MLTKELIIECNRKYWNDIIEMGKKYNIEPWRLVKLYDEYDIEQVLQYHPDFAPDTYDIHIVKFAEFVLEDTPIFSGDYVYHNIGEQVEIVNRKHANVINIRRKNKITGNTYQDVCYITQLTLKNPIINLPLNMTEIDSLLSILNDYQTLRYLGHQNTAKRLSDRLLEIKEEHSK